MGVGVGGLGESFGGSVGGFREISLSCATVCGRPPLNSSSTDTVDACVRRIDCVRFTAWPQSAACESQKSISFSCVMSDSNPCPPQAHSQDSVRAAVWRQRACRVAPSRCSCGLSRSWHCMDIRADRVSASRHPHRCAAWPTDCSPNAPPARNSLGLEPSLEYGPLADPCNGFQPG